MAEWFVLAVQRAADNSLALDSAEVARWSAGPVVDIALDLVRIVAAAGLVEFGNSGADLLALHTIVVDGQEQEIQQRPHFFSVAPEAILALNGLQVEVAPFPEKVEVILQEFVLSVLPRFSCMCGNQLSIRLWCLFQFLWQLQCLQL